MNYNCLNNQSDHNDIVTFGTKFTDFALASECAYNFTNLRIVVHYNLRLLVVDFRNELRIVGCIKDENELTLLSEAELQLLQKFKIGTLSENQAVTIKEIFEKINY